MPRKSGILFHPVAIQFSRNACHNVGVKYRTGRLSQSITSALEEMQAFLVPTQKTVLESHSLGLPIVHHRQEAKLWLGTTVRQEILKISGDKHHLFCNNVIHCCSLVQFLYLQLQQKCGISDSYQASLSLLQCTLCLVTLLSYYYIIYVVTKICLKNKISEKNRPAVICLYA